MTSWHVIWDEFQRMLARHMCKHSCSLDPKFPLARAWPMAVCAESCAHLKDWFVNHGFSSTPSISLDSVDIRNHPDQELVVMVMMMIIIITIISDTIVTIMIIIDDAMMIPWWCHDPWKYHDDADDARVIRWFDLIRMVMMTMMVMMMEI